MKKLLIIVCFALQLALAQTPNFSWAGCFPGASNDFGLAVTSDAQGNIYSTGAFKDQVDFDPGPGYNSPISAGQNDIYVQKLNAAGNLIWAVSIGSGLDDVGRGITVDGDGNVIVVGNYNGASVDFDPGPGVFNLTSSGGILCGFILKLSSSGNFIWAKQLSGSANGSVYSVDTDINNNIVIGGNFAGTFDFDPNAGISNLTSSAGLDGFVLKLDVNGNFIWVDQFAGSATDYVTAVKVSPTGDIGVVGSFLGTLDLDPGIPVQTGTGFGSTEGFIVKLRNNGSYVWGNVLTSNDNDVYYDLQFDLHSNIYATGLYRGNGIDFDPGPGVLTFGPAANNAFVQKLDSVNNLIWAKIIESSVDDAGYGIDVDELGNVISVGYFGATADFDPNAGVQNLTAVGIVDCYVQKMDADGNFMWVKGFGGTALDYARAITVDPFGNVSVVGDYNNTVDFDPGAGISSFTSYGGSDIFVEHFQCIPTSSVVNILSCGNYTSPSGNYIWNSDGTYQDTIANRSGCDSLMIINLTIHNPSSSSITTTACRLYTSPSGNSTWTTSGIYSDTIPNSVGCDSIISIVLTVTQIDTIITLSNGIFSVGQSGATYQWADCINQTPIVGATNQTFMPTVNGSYAMLITYNGCSDTTSCYSINNVGIDDMQSLEVNIYPNPTMDYLQITCAQAINKWQITDITGKIIYGNPNVEANNYRLDLSDLSSGIYLLYVSTANKTITNRIIKN